MCLLSNDGVRQLFIGGQKWGKRGCTWRRQNRQHLPQPNRIPVNKRWIHIRIHDGAMQAQRNCTITTPACKNPTWGRWVGAWNDAKVWREKSSILRHTENTTIELTNKRAFLLYIPLARSSFCASFTECGLAARRIYCIWQLRARQRHCPRNSQNCRCNTPLRLKRF